MGRPKLKQPERQCARCGATFVKKSKYSAKQWETAFWCSRACGVWNRGLSADSDHRVARVAEKCRVASTGRPGWSKGLTKADHPSLARVSAALTGRKGRPANDAQKRGLKLGQSWCAGLTARDHPGLARRGAAARQRQAGKPNPAHSERMKRLYAERPDLHPNAIVAKKTKGRGFTYIERVIATLLDEIGVSYAFNCRTGRYWPDFRIDAAGLIIEADGEYWHQDPEREATRDAALAAMGWRVLHLPGKLIVNNPAECAALIAEALHGEDLRPADGRREDHREGGHECRAQGVDPRGG